MLRLVAAGISNKEIAARLHLSPRTVEKHVENLLRITAAQSRTQLVVLAGRGGTLTSNHHHLLLSGRGPRRMLRRVRGSTRTGSSPSHGAGRKSPGRHAPGPFGPMNGPYRMGLDIRRPRPLRGRVPRARAQFLLLALAHTGKAATQAGTTTRSQPVASHILIIYSRALEAHPLIYRWPNGWQDWPVVRADRVWQLIRGHELLAELVVTDEDFLWLKAEVQASGRVRGSPPAV